MMEPLFQSCISLKTDNAPDAGGSGRWSVFLLRDGTSGESVPSELLLVELVRQYIRSGDVPVMGSETDTAWNRIIANIAILWGSNGVDGMMPLIYGMLEPGDYFVSLQDKPLTECSSSHPEADEIEPTMHHGVADAALECGFCWVLSRILETPEGPLSVDVARR